MTKYLAVITAYGAAALLAWLAVLLYPRLMPEAGRFDVLNRWKAAGLLLFAVALSVGISVMRGEGWLLDYNTPWVEAVNQLLMYIPLLGYMAYIRSPSGLLIPSTNNLHSLGIGLGIGIVTVCAFFSSLTTWQGLEALTTTIASADAVPIIVRSLLRCLVVGAFLALVMHGWSKATALAIGGIAIALTQLPGLLSDGFSLDWLMMLLAHVALVLGLLSSILATRNIVWFMPVFVLLNLLQFSVM